MPLGVMLGYVVSGYLVSYGISWRLSFVVQAVMLGPLVLGLSGTPERYIQKHKAPPKAKSKSDLVQNTLDDIDEAGESTPERSFTEQLGVLMSSSVFILSTLGKKV
jgi:MFS family permease